jgi:hypothetical protein
MTTINHQMRRCAKINSAVFDIVYEDMCQNDEVKSIHAVVLALNPQIKPSSKLYKIEVIIKSITTKNFLFIKICPHFQ